MKTALCIVIGFLSMSAFASEITESEGFIGPKVVYCVKDSNVVRHGIQLGNSGVLCPSFLKLEPAGKDNTLIMMTISLGDLKSTPSPEVDACYHANKYGISFTNGALWKKGAPFEAAICERVLVRNE